MSGKGLHEDSVPLPSAISSSALSARPVAAVAATGTAGGSDHVSDTALISACLVSVSGRCQCYNHNGIHIPLSQADCLLNTRSPSSAWRLNSPAERPDFSRPVQNVDSSRWVFSDSPQVPSLRF